MNKAQKVLDLLLRKAITHRILDRLLEEAAREIGHPRDIFLLSWNNSLALKTPINRSIIQHLLDFLFSQIVLSAIN